jgi:hypothetical protein
LFLKFLNQSITLFHLKPSDFHIHLSLHQYSLQLLILFTGVICLTLLLLHKLSEYLEQV